MFKSPWATGSNCDKDNSPCWKLHRHILVNELGSGSGGQAINSYHIEIFIQWIGLADKL